jgi:hypothetical protein
MKRRDIKELSYYRRLQLELQKEYKRRPIIIISILLAFAFGLFGFVFTQKTNQNPDDTIIIIMLFTALGLIIPIIGIIGYQNLSQSEYEERLINIGKEFIRRNELSNSDVDIIEKRAEIGSAAVTGRTIIGIIVVSFLVALFSEKIPLTIDLLLATLVLFVSFFYLIELDRGNLDVIIRQICITYKGEFKKRKRR